MNIPRFITDLENCGSLLTEFDEGLWCETVETVTVHSESGVTYPSVYGRMFWDEPAPTITTQFYGYVNGRFGHPEQDRAISMREGAMLQSFPSDYDFLPPDKIVSKKELGIHIGNAVPVNLGAAFAIWEHVV